MKFTIQQITDSRAEEVLVKCCDSQAAWVEKVRKVVSAQNTVGVYKNGAFYRLELSDIYCFRKIRSGADQWGNGYCFAEICIGIKTPIRNVRRNVWID